MKQQVLCDIHKSNQIESNSQRQGFNILKLLSCVISTKVIKLKAIHNAKFKMQLTEAAV